MSGPNRGGAEISRGLARATSHPGWRAAHPSGRHSAADDGVHATRAAARRKRLGAAIHSDSMPRICGFLHPPVNFRFRCLAQLQAKSRYCRRRYVRVENKLEDHGDVAVLGGTSLMTVADQNRPR